MIRFAIKCALGLGLLALVLPLGSNGDAKESKLDLFGLAVGFQEAVSDIGGFCSRAPAACDAAREVAVFAGDRIEDGFRIGYAFVGEKLMGVRQEMRDAPAPEMIKPSGATIAETAVAADPSLPQPYQPPKRAEPKDARAEIPAEDVPATPARVPTPHPRG